MLAKVIAVAASGLLASTTLAAPAPLGDAEIAHVAYTAGAIDVAAGKLALSRSQDPVVRSFAEEMVRDHKAVNEQAMALVKKLGVTPKDNPTSESLQNAANVESNKLSTLKGAAFDREYIDNEVAYHRTVNGALKSTLIPDAKNAQLKSLLATGLQLFSEHLAHAEQIAAKLH